MSNVLFREFASSRQLQVCLLLHIMRMQIIILSQILFISFLIQVNVSISGKDSSSVEVALRCLATENDGFGPNKLADGGILAAVIAAGVKGKFLGH